MWIWYPLGWHFVQHVLVGCHNTRIEPHPDSFPQFAFDTFCSALITYPFRFSWYCRCWTFLRVRHFFGRYSRPMPERIYGLDGILGDRREWGVLTHDMEFLKRSISVIAADYSLILKGCDNDWWRTDGQTFWIDEVLARLALLPERLIDSWTHLYHLNTIGGVNEWMDRWMTCSLRA